MEANPYKYKPPLYQGLLPRIEIIVVIALVGVVSFLVLSRRTRFISENSKDCEYSKVWSDWGACTTDCGFDGWQYATRSVLQYPVDQGAPCDPLELLKSQSCGSSATCGQNCIPGNPEEIAWSPCPKCIYATETPMQWKVVPPIQQATGNGQDCNTDQVFQSRLCTAAIPQCPPDIDCVLNQQSVSDCTLGPCEVTGQTGFLTRIFTVSTQSSGRGRQCDFSQLVRVEECTIPNPGDCNCAGTVWGAWSECNASCGPGVRVRIAQTPNPNCPVIDFEACEYTPCENGTCVPPPIDLVLAECYLQCAGLPTSSFAPGMCSTSSIFTQVCAASAVQGNCLPPQPCSLTSWSDWGACPSPCTPENPLGSTQTRLRSIIQPSRGGGQACTDPNLILTDTQPCNNYVPVTYSAYDIVNNQFLQSVSQDQCPPPGPCGLSQFYPVTPCENRYMCLSVTDPVQPDIAEGTISFARSITNFTPECYSLPYTSFFTTSKCGWGPGDASAQPVTLPSCTECKWAQIVLSSEQQAAMCSSAGSARFTGFFPNTLVVESNVLNDQCANHPNACDYLTADTTTCSVLTRSCHDIGMCPQDSSTPPRLCSGNGYAVYFSGPDPSVPLCSCSCFSPFSGESCSTVSTQCPIAPVSNLPCNGLGNCVAGACQCFDANDTTADCTAEAWCWVYGNVQSSAYSTYQKLLGAIPVRPGFFSGFFNETDCASLNRNVLSAMPPQFVVRKPKVIDYRVGPAAYQDQTFSVFDASLETRVNYFAPPNLQAANTPPCFNNDTFSSADLLARVFGALDGINSFKPVIVPNSIPTTCELPTVFSAFVPSPQPLVQAIPRPLLTSDTVNYNPTTTTFTQIRLLTLSAPQQIDEMRTDAFGLNRYSALIFGDNLTMSRGFYVNPLLGPTAYGLNNQLQYLDLFSMDMQGTIIKDFGAPNFFDDQGRLVFPASITVRFPWLPTQTVDTQYVDVPNGADFTATLLSASPTRGVDSCFQPNGDPIPACYNQRNNLVYDRMAAPFLNNDLHNIRFTQSRYFYFSVNGTGPQSNGDFTLNHPFCTLHDQYSVTKEFPINDRGGTWNAITRQGDPAPLQANYNAAGTIFTCQLMRYFLSRGEGTVLPVTISFVR